MDLKDARIDPWLLKQNRRTDSQKKKKKGFNNLPYPIHSTDFWGQTNLKVLLIQHKYTYLLIQTWCFCVVNIFTREFRSRRSPERRLRRNKKEESVVQSEHEGCWWKRWHHCMHCRSPETSKTTKVKWKKKNWIKRDQKLLYPMAVANPCLVAIWFA